MSPRTLTLAAVGLLAGTALLTTGSADAKRRQKPPATTTLAPGSSATFSNPRSSVGGSPLASGKPM